MTGAAVAGLMACRESGGDGEQPLGSDVGVRRRITPAFRQSGSGELTNRVCQREEAVGRGMGDGLLVGLTCRWDSTQAGEVPFFSIM